MPEAIAQHWMSEAATVEVVAALTRAGTEVRFVGGCVRDALAGRPVTDIDIATPDPPETVVRLLEAAGIRAIPTGIEHGTVTAVSRERHFEITTLRVDVETDGRRARVAFTDDWTVDAARRDLTINALSCSVDGRLFDPFGGAADLASGRIRFVGDAEQRIREDVLRLLRFFRFFAHYGQPPLDRDGLAACRMLADRLPTLSGERVQAEVLKLLSAETAADVLAAMATEGILGHILPEAMRFERLRGLIALEKEPGVDPSALRRLAAVLAIDAAGAEAVAGRLKLAAADRDYLRETATGLEAFGAIDDPAARRRWFYRHGAGAYRELLLLWSAEAPAPPDDLAAQLDDAARWRKQDFPVGGADVLALGVPKGPRVGAALRTVEEWWIERDFAPDREACLRHLRAHLAGTDMET